MIALLIKMVQETSGGDLITNFADPTTESLLGLNKLKTRFLIKRNATVNRYYDQIQAELNSPCAKDCLWDKAWWQQGFPLTRIRNPGGKWMTRLLMINVHGRAQKMEQRSDNLAEILARLKA